MSHKVFLASSSESKRFADAIRRNLHDAADVNVWDQSLQLSAPILEGLFANLRQADFGIVILSQDDSVRIRGEHFTAPRDNVMFELGLFMGGLGNERVMFLVPEELGDGTTFRLAPDLQGLVHTTFNAKDAADIAVVAACDKIRTQIETLGTRRQYHITNRHSARCLDVVGWKRKPGTRIAQWGYHGGANQLWRLERTRQNFYRIRSVHSQLYLTAGPQGARHVEQQDLNEREHLQEWAFTELPNDTYRISLREDDDLCLSVEGERTDDGAAAVLSDWRHDAPYEWWLNLKVTLPK